MLQYQEEGDVTIFWFIEIIDEYSFHLVINFSDNLLVSQFDKMLDNIVIEVLQV